MTKAELIAALEAATGPSREMDWWCWWYGKSTEATKPAPRPPADEYLRDSLAHNNSPRFSASIDAALSLYREKPDTVSTDPRKVCIDALRQH